MVFPINDFVAPFTVCQIDSNWRDLPEQNRSGRSTQINRVATAGKCILVRKRRNTLTLENRLCYKLANVTKTLL